MLDEVFREFDALAGRLGLEKIKTIGIHSGPVIAGVIGTVKFAYDLWGDTVNTASRLESHGVTGQIYVTEAVYQRLKGRHQFTERGELEIKGKGLMKTYLFEAVA